MDCKCKGQGLKSKMTGTLISANMTELAAGAARKPRTGEWIVNGKDKGRKVK